MSAHMSAHTSAHASAHACQCACRYAKDEQVAAQSKAFLMNDVTGHYPPNASYGAILLATALNETDPSKKDPWVAHTTYAPPNVPSNVPSNVLSNVPSNVPSNDPSNVPS